MAEEKKEGKVGGSSRIDFFSRSAPSFHPSSIEVISLLQLNPAEGSGGKSLYDVHGEAIIPVYFLLPQRPLPQKGPLPNEGMEVKELLLWHIMNL